jgi:hypothetical protein
MTARLLKAGLDAGIETLAHALEAREEAINRVLTESGVSFGANPSLTFRETLHALREAQEAYDRALADIPPQISEETKQWLEIRKKEALLIDPATAEYMWAYGQTMDPYGVEPDLPPYLQQVQRNHFYRRPGSDISVSIHDLPEETAKALHERDEARRKEEARNAALDQ